MFEGGKEGAYKIPDTVEEISVYAFSYCNSLTSLEIPESVTTIYYDAFENCTGLTDLTIAASSISDETFKDCTSLTSLTLEEGVESIGNSAFSGCTGLTGQLTIPAGVTSIGSYAFSSSSITSIYVDPNNEKYASDDGLLLNKEKNKVIQCPGGGETDAYKIPDTVTDIRTAFSSCISLTTITIPNSVTSIGYYAFRLCDSLTSIIISNSTTEFDDYAVGFSGPNSPKNTALTIVGYPGSTAQTYADDNGFKFADINQ